MATDQRLKGVRALVVDDSLETLDYLCALLETAGAKATCVTLAEDALRLLDVPDPPFDVLVSDIRLLGEHDGTWLIEQVRTRKAPVSRIPAVAFTADANFTFVGDLRRAGFDGVVMKPAGPIQLIDGIARVLPGVRRG